MKKSIFIAYNSKDKIHARIIYQYLERQCWDKVEVFMDEFSLKPGESIALIEDYARASSLALVLYNEHYKNSEYVPQEVGIFKSFKIPIIYVTTDSQSIIPPGYDKFFKSFEWHSYKNPFLGLEDLTKIVEGYLEVQTLTARQYNLLAVRFGKSQEKRDIELAIYYCDKAIELDPGYDFPYSNKLFYLSKLQRLREAQELSNIYLHIFPKNFFINKFAGLIYFKLDEYQEAINVLERALIVNSTDQGCLRYLAESYIKLGEPAKAISFLERCIQVNNKTQSAYEAANILHNMK